MINLGKQNNDSGFDFSALLKWFVIIIFIWCPFYFAYHHFIVNDVFIKTQGVVAEKNNHLNSKGNYVYELIIKTENGKSETQIVDADAYIHTEINKPYTISNFNVHGINPVMIVVGAIELFALAILALILFVAAGG